MSPIADLLFEARILKDIPRSGYAFLGAGKESVAEHTFMVAFIGFVMARICPDVDGGRLVSMCLVHDLPESRIGDLNYVQKQYVTPQESKAVDDIVSGLPFGAAIAELIAEYNGAESPEARLAHDADQLSLLLDLKGLKDTGHPTPDLWLPPVLDRLKTETGRELARQIMATNRDDWWLNIFR